MAKTIAFYVRNVDPEKEPFSSRDLYYYSYQEYLLAIKAAGAEVYFVSGMDSYEDKGRFSRAWSINAVSEVADFTPVGAIQADLVFEKGGFRELDIPTVTDIRLFDLMGNKATMYEKFGRYQPKTVICDDRADVEAAIALMPGERVVVKNPEGNGGKRVYIGTKGDIAVPAEETYPLLVQEFVDMSDGIPGIATGVHDVRVLMTGSTIIGATLRQPPAGGLYANVSKGATETLLSHDEIPAEVRQLAHEIDSQLDDLPRYYAIDFARGKQGWKLVELNKQPGLFTESTGPLARQFMQSFAQYIVDVCP